MNPARYLLLMGILDDLTSATCSSCHWWHSDNNTEGECLHDSPNSHYNPTTDTYLTFWPVTAASERCGAHQFRGTSGG